MKKQFFTFIFNIFIIISIILSSVYVSSNYPDVVVNICSALVNLSNPVGVVQSVKSNITYNIDGTADNNTNNPTQQDSAVMRTIGSKDSDDDSITKTPSDVAKLMKTAKKTINKSKAIGKTSEEAYQGGGTIISYGKLQIQSKIPSSFYSPNIKSLLSTGADLEITDKSKPTILIYHSHTTEAYSMLDVGYYIYSDSRSNDNNKNMVRVGNELVSYLTKAGFNVIHDTKIHDVDYNASYDSSRKIVEKYLEQYPSIDITIDVHRDDITYQNKTKVKPTATINGKKAARMMIISGCEYGRVKNFPDWEYNLRFDLQVQNKVNQLYPNLMRPILFSERKYNMYETHNSFLLEIGTDANTLDEACYSARLFGKALGELLNEKYVKE